MSQAAPSKGTLRSKFVLATYIAVGSVIAAGLGGEIYSMHEGSSSLAQDYGRAASCEQKLAHKETCTAGERVSVAKKTANEDFGDLCEGASGMAIASLCLQSIVGIKRAKI